MTVAEIRKLADQAENDRAKYHVVADTMRALADAVEAAKGLESVVGDQDLRRVRNSVSIALARVEALKP